MGCCQSSPKERELTKREKGGGQKVTHERTPLLSDSPSPLHEDHNNQQEKDKEKAEKEALREVVQRASENLINITETAAHIPGPDSTERTEAFKDIINTSSIQKPSKLPKPSKAIDSNSLTPLLTTSIVTQEETEKLQQQVSSISETLKNFKVKDVGPIVESLPEL